MPKQNKTRKTKGGCGCQNNDNTTTNQQQYSIFKGGNLQTVAFDTSNKYTYPLNMHTSGGDPLSPDMVISTRIQPNMVSGGSQKGGSQKGGSKKRKNASKKRKSDSKKSTKKRRSNIKKKKGGSQFLDSHNANVASTFFTASGAPVSAHIITGINSQLLNQNTQLNTQTPFI